MLSFLKHLNTSASGMAVQSERLRLVSENIANADTPGYRRKLATFEQSFDRRTSAKTVELDQVLLDQSPLREVYDPTHPLADDTGNVTFSNVNMVTEIADAREAQRSFEANLQMFDQSRRMYGAVLDLLRR
ncbi:MAG: flagellar basal body rod protein FlgC [Pseudomonadota bacterium]